MNFTRQLLPILLIIIVTLTACPPLQDTTQINQKKATTLINNFERSGIEAFASSYIIDIGVRERMGENTSSLLVFHGLDALGKKVVVLAPVDQRGALVQAGPFMIQHEGNLCPPVCDRGFSEAISISRNDAVADIQRYMESRRRDSISAFRIASPVLEAFRSQDNNSRFVKVCHGLNERERSLVLMAVSDNGILQMNMIYQETGGNLCPPVCDIITPAANR